MASMALEKLSFESAYGQTDNQTDDRTDDRQKVITNIRYKMCRLNDIVLFKFLLYFFRMER